MNNNNNNELEQLDIKRMLEIIMDRMVTIIVITLIFGMLSFFVSANFITPKYESYITMFINNQKETSSNDGETEQGKILSSDITASQQLVPTYIEMIKSNNVMEAVADKFNDKTNNNYSAKKIKEMVETSSVSDTEILKVTVKNPDPAVATEIANIIADVAPEKIQSFVERSQVKIVDHAKNSTIPVSPNVRNNTILGALLGLILSISVILLRELFDVRVKSVDDLVVRFPYPVIGTVPEIYVSYETSGNMDEDLDAV